MSSPCPTAECWSVSYPDGSIGIVCTSIKCREERPPETQSAGGVGVVALTLVLLAVVLMRALR